MLNKIRFLWVALLVSYNLFSQTDSLFVEIDTLAVEIPVTANQIHNPEAMQPFFHKLQKIQKEKNGKINIVHIGDSHIQADFFSGYMRKNLQSQFGNGGRGLVFPHSLAKTNGVGDVRFTSNQSWESQRNISPDSGKPVGISGFSLETKADDFVIDMTVKNPEYHFSQLKIITPNNQKMFDVALSYNTIVVESEKPKTTIHKIKSGENLSVIAAKYNVSVSSIKSANGLKGTAIRAGKTLKIPTNQKEKLAFQRKEFIPLVTEKEAGFYSFKTDTLLSSVYLIPALEAKDYALNGIVLENNTSGIVYHTIGVNGAKYSDYTKYPLFFEQLAVLQPDLVIISLGTNESFDKMVTPEYMKQLLLMKAQILTQNPNAILLITTPPPSQFKRRYPNTFVADYTREILAQASTQNYAVWDLFSQLGGLFGVSKNLQEGIIGGDKVHYTKKGYEYKGQLFLEALINAFQNYNTETDK